MKNKKLARDMQLYFLVVSVIIGEIFVFGFAGGIISVLAGLYMTAQMLYYYVQNLNLKEEVENKNGKTTTTTIIFQQNEKDVSSAVDSKFIHPIKENPRTFLN